MVLVDSPSEPRTAAAPVATGTAPPDDAGRLLVSCPDRPGVVAAVTGLLATWGANITESQQYTTDPEGGRFFLRLEFVLDGLEHRLMDLEHAFAGLADAFAMEWRITRAAPVKRLAVFVGRADHALAELIWRRRYGDLRADIAMVISNHRDLEGLARAHDLPFHHVPITPETTAAAEETQLELLAGGVDVVVLARYMRILSGGMLRRLPCPAINIHHSFLPAFVGADPYGAAARRGVKLIGATAHYVTEELDAGPIIEQDVRRVDHRFSAAELRRAGRYVERDVLARAVSWHVDDRVIVHGNKTIVFG